MLQDQGREALSRAAAEGFHVVLTNDARRMRRLEPYGDGVMVREFRDHLNGELAA